MIGPYSSLPESSFWNLEIANNLPANVSLMHGLKKFKISKNDKVMTIGSCFAQHITQFLKKTQNNILITERNNLYSANYGNVYTISQGLQLLQRSLNRDSDGEIWLHKESGQYCDSYRPNIVETHSGEFDSVILGRLKHLESVYKAFSSCDVLIFTLGLTEGWKNIKTGQVFQVAPGHDAGVYDPTRHSHFDLSILEIEEQLNEFIKLLFSINLKVKIIFTVSPVHLAATYLKQNILISSFNSKIKIRASLENIIHSERVFYFPSFEFIFSLSQMGQFYDATYRGVTPQAVRTVMRQFGEAFLGDVYSNESHQDYSRQEEINTNVICDEETVVRKY